MELVVVAALVVEEALELEDEADAVVGVAAAVKAVVAVLMLGMVGQQTRSPRGFLSSAQFIKLQNSSLRSATSCAVTPLKRSSAYASSLIMSSKIGQDSSA